jgi:polyisoprenoid-binding protein YceI
MKLITLGCALLLTANALAQLKGVDSIKDSTAVTYHLDHPLHTIEATSTDASFHAEIDSASNSISSVKAHVDVMTFNSGNSNRDSHAMEVIDALTYPDVSFSSTKIDTAGDGLAVTGNVTFHGITKEVVATVVPRRTHEILSVTGGFNLSLTDFKIDRPSLLMVPVGDTLRFSLKTAFRLP